MVANVVDIGSDSSIRSSIFMELVDSMEKVTPSEIAERVGTSRENAYHHLSWLVDAGLLIRDEGEYYVQPPLIDPSFSDRIDETLAELAPDAAELMYVDPSWSTEQQVHAIANCVQTAMALSFMDANVLDEE